MGFGEVEASCGSEMRGIDGGGRGVRGAVGVWQGREEVERWTKSLAR